MTPSLEQQLRYIRRDAHLGLNAFKALLTAREPEVIDMMEARVAAGFAVYGTTGWRKSPYELDNDTLEEGADGGAYQVMKRFRLQNPQLFV